MTPLKLHEAAIRDWEHKVHALVDWQGSPAGPKIETSPSGPLRDWIIGVKDIIDVEGIPTCCNAPFVPALPARKNAEIVQKFISLGATVLSKTVTTTFAYFDPGPTRNPWNLNHTPGGSSSGSAVAVACGMVRLALGSQTVASVNRPASFCGVVGFKPTYDRLPITGVFPFSPSVDTLGYFTRTVLDAQQAFTSLVGLPETSGTTPIRVGVTEDLYVEPAEEEMLLSLRNVCRQLEISGLEVIPCQLPSFCDEAQEHHWSLVAAEAAISHENLFAKYGKSYPPKLRDLILRGQQITSSQMQVIDSHRKNLQTRLKVFLEEFDLLITPSAPGAAPVGIDTTGDPRFSLLWTYAGFPTLTLPADLSRNGLPLGIQLVSNPYKDHELLSAGLTIERIISFPSMPI